MKKVLIYTQWFDPEPTFKGIVFAKELKKIGFDVEVLTGIPNYPVGKIYSGYKNGIFQTEVMDGIKIKRVYLFPNHDRSAIKRVLNYISFAATSFVYLMFFQKKVDVIYTYHPPLTTGVVSSLIRFFRRIPIVYDVQDIWPDTLRATGMLNNEIILKFIGSLAACVYKTADELVVLSPGFKKLLISRGVDEGKITVIPNWCDENSIKKKDELLNFKLPGSNSFKVLFAGNIGKAQNLDIILDVAKKLRNEVDFIFLGDGIEKKHLMDRRENENIHNAIFLPAVPMAQVSEYMNASDALLVFLKEDSLFEITIPSKTQAYMFFGKPIIMGVKGDAEDIIRNSNSGIIISQTNVEEITMQLKEFSSLHKQSLLEMGERANAYYLEKLSLESGSASFAKIFNKLIR